MLALVFGMRACVNGAQCVHAGSGRLPSGGRGGARPHRFRDFAANDPIGRQVLVTGGFMALIGIDLGTTNSLIAVFGEAGPALIPNALGDMLTPSVIGVDDADEIVVG